MAVRDLAADPYRPDEERVAAHLRDLGVEPEADPIGLLMLLHGSVCRQLASRVRAPAVEETPLPRTDLPKPDGPGVPRGRVVDGPQAARGPFSEAHHHPLSTSAMGSARNP